MNDQPQLEPLQTYVRGEGDAREFVILLMQLGTVCRVQTAAGKVELVNVFTLKYPAIKS